MQYAKVAGMIHEDAMRKVEERKAREVYKTFNTIVVGIIVIGVIGVVLSKVL